MTKSKPKTQRFFVLANGSYWGSYEGPGRPEELPPGAYEVSSAPAHARDIWDSAEEIWQAFEDPEAYRHARQADYLAEVGEIGDQLDAILKHLAGDTAEADRMAAKSAEIKARHPKPNKE